MTFPRYVVAGALNTGATYLLYLALIRHVPYGWAYTASYVAGILLGYVLNAYWVFREGPSAKTLLAYPLVYLVGYAAGVAGLALAVEVLHLPTQVAPLLGVALSVPATYVAASKVFNRGNKA